MVGIRNSYEKRTIFELLGGRFCDVDKYLTVAQACELWQVERHTIYRWIAKGKLQELPRIGQEHRRIVLPKENENARG